MIRTRRFVGAGLAFLVAIAAGAIWLKQWEPAPGFQTLVGRWLRPDGGYVLEIRSVDPTGELVAAYLNPRPIHVARAEASRDGTTTKVFVELRDVNYPGSTYTLTYDRVSDQLRGVYFHAGLGQRFNICFERQK